MSLPGKLCIGILEEDNPLRSYFRFKPLLIDEGGKYAPYGECDRYPDEGCIRIVPDKNESYYFKTRMRQTGLFCVVDLRDHPGDSDKIRPNKNYRPGGEEINGYIIYSDVVRGPAANMIYQVLPAESGGAIVPTPNTDAVLLRQGGELLPERHGWDAVETSGSMVLLRVAGEPCPVEDMQVFDLPGFRGETISFAIMPAAKMDAVSDAPERPARRGEDRHAPDQGRPAKVERKPEPKPAPRAGEEAPKPEERPAAEAAKPEAAAPAEPVAPAEPAASAKPVAPVEPAVTAEPAVPVEPVAPAEPAAPAAAPAEPAAQATPAEPAAPAEKPWFHHDESIAARPVNRRMSRAEQLMAEQVGLNPRKGRSLQELIDEKWVQSRVAQIATPVSPIATGEPVRSPVEIAAEAIRAVWDQPNMRRQLIESLSQADELEDALQARRAAVRQSAVNRDLDELEAQRLELLGELERLKAGNRNLRERLKQEILKDEARALADAVGKTRAAREEQAKYEKAAEDARAAAQDARSLLDSLAGEELERRIRDVALTRRVAQRLDLLKEAAEGAPPEAERIDIAALIARLKARMDAEGWQYDDFTAANLCVCLALSPVLMLSGGPGSGKSRCARMLADALGLFEAGRAAALSPSDKNLREDAAVAGLLRAPGTPAALLLDDANLIPAVDVLRGMGELPGPEWRAILTLQDTHSGLPVCAAALDRGFLVRMEAPEALPWRPAEVTAAAPEALASIAAVAGALPRADVPQALVTRMEALRRDLTACGARVSRRALNDSWRYCAAMLALLGEDADADAIFDCAVAQRVLPALMASAAPDALPAISRLMDGMPHCHALLNAPAPVSV